MSQQSPKSQKTPKAPKAPKAQKTSAAKVEKPFSPTIVTNFLNNYYRNIAMKDPKKQNISFKVAPTDGELKPQQLSIDLKDYLGLRVFNDTYKLVMSQAEASEDPEKTKKAAMDRTIDLTFDMKLRACLDNARVYKTNDKTKLNTFQEFIIPQLGFDSEDLMNIKDYINGVSAYFADESKLKTKIYNLVFPHDSHDPDKLPVGVNVIYLQHVSKYHDKILDLVINKNADEAKAMKEVQKLYAGEFKVENFFTEEDVKKMLKRLSLTEDDLPEIEQKIKTQLLHPAIITNIAANPTTDKKGKQVMDFKWIDELNAVKINKSKLTETNEPMTVEQKKVIKALVRELLIAKSFVKIINGGNNARKIEEVDGKQVAVPMKPNLKVCLENYNRVYGETVKFYNDWKARIDEELERIEQEKEAGAITVEDAEGKTADEIIIEKEEEQQYALFLKYFIESVRFIKNTLGYAQPFKAFMNDVKKYACFKFSKAIHTEIEKLIAAEEFDESKVDEIAAVYHKSWKFINIPKSYDPNDLDIYSKIGKYCGLDIKREFRIAVGIAITAFIQEKIELLKAANSRKKELQIYIKV